MADHPQAGNISSSLSRVRVAWFRRTGKMQELAMPNELGYFTLPVKDLPRAKRFYGALFGWEVEEGGHVANTKFPLGLSPDGPAELPNVYFRVDDIDKAAARVSQLGGTVRSRNTYPSGPNAVCADPDGTVFSLWQPAAGYE
jgi:uncharacterized protein